MIFTELRKFLIWINTIDNKDSKRFISYCLSIILGATVLGLLIDIFLTPNNIVNLIKAIIVLVNGTTIFSLIYSQAGSNFNEDRETFRALYSYRQRINIAIIATFVIGLLFSLLISNTSPIYCLVSSILVAIGIMLLTFVRPTKEEYIRSAYGIKDGRDAQHSEEIRLRTEEFEERKRKQKEEKAKKNKKK